LASHHVFEIRLEHIVDEHENKVVDKLSDGEQRVHESLLFAGGRT
jgi:hypothetical protein